MTTLLSPPPIPSAPVLDNMQDLLRRKREVETNKRRHHLTEAECNLLLTNANEFTFTDGQVIGRRGDDFTAAYRVKSGTIKLLKDEKQVCELKQGWFIGETVFLRDSPTTLEVDMVADGTVVLAELNVPFVQRLFEVDRTLALKFYRHVASKHSAIYYSIIEDLILPGNRIDVTITDTSTSSSDSSNPSTSTATTSRSPSLDGLNEITFSTPRRKLTKRQSFHIARAPLKSYPLEAKNGGKTALIKSKKIEISTETMGLRFKKQIPFSTISNFVRTSELSVTIVSENNRAKTLFFKQASDLESFYGVLQSLVEQVAQPTTKTQVTGPISTPKKSDSPSYSTSLAEIAEKYKSDRDLLSRLGVTRSYKKGDIVVEEGDLFQRLYMLKSGSVSSNIKGIDINPLQAGDSFGVITMLNLRPYPTTVVVTSETAEIVIIPTYKIQELIAHDDDLAARFYQKAATIISLQIEKFIKLNIENGYLNY